MVRRAVWGWWFVLGAVACGARSNLDVREVDSDRPVATTATASTGGGGGAGGGGGLGAGGAGPSCDDMVWSGLPVGVGVADATTALRPRLVATSPTTTALVFELSTGGGAASTELFSVPLQDAFSTWPPAVGVREVHFPLVGPVAVAEGEPKEVAFAAIDPSPGETVLGRFEPETNGATFSGLDVFETPVALERVSLDGFVFMGETQNILGIYSVSTVVAPPLVRPLGSLGGADRPLAAEIETTGVAGWVVNTSDQPLDDCGEPDVPGPPRYANLWRYSVGDVTPVAALEFFEDLDDIDVAVGASGVWMGVGDTQGRYAVLEVAPPDPPDLQAVLVTEPIGGVYDLAAIVDAALLVGAFSNPALPEDPLRVTLVSGDGERASLVASPETGPAASGPTVLVAERSALIAWSGGAGTIWVGRVSCVDDPG
ncbi:MAG: hypothetical protein AAF715_26875 [Myxococcota bacterium]